MSFGFQQASERARKTSDKISGAFKEVQQKQTIDDIISSALDSDNPQAVQASIGKILSSVSPERQPAAIKYLESVAERKVQEQAATRERSALEKAGIDPNLPRDIQKEAFKAKLQKEEGKQLKLNEELNQQKSRTKSKVDDIIRPYGMIDPFTRMITWNKDVGEKERSKINKKIEAERKKSFSVQKNLYKRYGQPVPEDLEETLEEESSLGTEDTERSAKVDEAVNLLKQLMGNQ